MNGARVANETESDSFAASGGGGGDRVGGASNAPGADSATRSSLAVE